MRHLRAVDRATTPWKNGGGVTSEIVVYPDCAGFLEFDWRISIATVERDGPFSIFPGIDRTLTLLTGNGVRLDIAGKQQILTRQSPPCSFPGDVAAAAFLLDGPITDLNVMSRRGKIRHSVTRLGPNASIIVAEASVLLWIDGTGEVATPTGSTKPDKLDALVCPEAGEWRIDGDLATLAYLVGFAPTTA